MNTQKSILFLYTEIAEYFLACIEELCIKGYIVHVVRFPVNKEAPFSFRNIENLTMYTRTDFSEIQLIKLSKKINPDIIFVSGWIDKTYLKIAKIFHSKIPTVISLDNHWKGTFKQQIARTIGRFFIKSKFNYAWVPGQQQKNYAIKLGFSEKEIFTDYYCADIKLYQQFFDNYFQTKNKSFPKKFLFVGRYINQKGIFDLWNAFIDLQNEKPNEWELICIGTGDLFDQRIEHPKIKHLGFVQPKDFGEIIQQTGVFVLPSLFEPWGVVVHEFATAGYPLVCSSEVGAAYKFISENENGFMFAAGNKNEIKNSLMKIINFSDEELTVMSKKSNELSKRITPQLWAQTIETMLNIKNNSKFNVV